MFILDSTNSLETKQTFEWKSLVKIGQKVLDPPHKKEWLWKKYGSFINKYDILN